MHHQRHVHHFGHALGDLGRGDPPASDDDPRGPHLDAAYDVAIGFDHRKRPIDVDGAPVGQFRHAVAGDKTDRTDVQESLDRLACRVDHIFAQAVKTGLARRSGIGHRSDSGGAAGFRGADGNIGAAMPDMNMQVAPAG